ncbi:MAG: 50S ribosomal protein L6 [Euryarchaeota archaeon]|jgi:large subunit ribosomal protein L6|nr:50S ribosomal protein L6 [Euryarchaeota archaeon]MBT3654546.1 50S ribosomal protein L6 [Euryarchaeota archaeon]MBT3757378.1 50S ribosomal protein L6 [Euryarchaeota archaeon]MBT4050717.1 50S ribosomal protein L6 [Euryarchaeota archaeon]MBT4345961.1 50S ribosomal protein L6 [Euryarchaeota archaeon]|tara:strand:+ start:2932 stop:3483 length:552 start_codon:yes stop_codon:yes gene_type:complete
MPKLDHIAHKISFTEGVSATIEGNSVTISKGPSTLTREFLHPRVAVKQSDDGLEVFCDLPRRVEKALAGTWAAHLRNMVHGVDSGFEYTLKAVYSHFPMTIKVQGNIMTITNLFGEKVPREAKLPWSPADVEVQVKNKTDVIVRGADREKVGQTAANIERACAIKKRDRRVFQDGIYITSKGA